MPFTPHRGQPHIRTWPGTFQAHGGSCWRAWRAYVVMPSGWWSGAGDMAWAEVATAKTIATATNLIIVTSICSVFADFNLPLTEHYHG
jgi:hypothetical protein